MQTSCCICTSGGGCNCRLSALLRWGHQGELPAQVRTGQQPGFHALLLVDQVSYWVAQVAHLLSES